MLRRWARDQKGATAIEYAMIASMIAVVVLGAVKLMVGNLGLVYSSIETAVGGALK